LLDAAEKWARGVGCDAISVRSNVKRERAHQFYRDNGYIDVKIRLDSISTSDRGLARLTISQTGQSRVDCAYRLQDQYPDAGVDVPLRELLRLTFVTGGVLTRIFIRS